VPAATLLRTDAERAGERVYRRERCDRCHTLAETPPPAGGPLPAPGAPSASVWSGRAGPDLGLEGHRRSDDWHFAHLYAPGVLVRGSRMPAYRHLFRSSGGRPEPNADGRALVAYLQALGRADRDVWAERRRQEPEIPPPPPRSAGLLAEGSALYAVHCEACHGAGGDGAGAAAPFLAPPPRDFTTGRYVFQSTPAGAPPRDADLYRFSVLGGGTGSAMPGFGFLSPRELWALVLRVKEFSPALRATDLGPGGAAGQAFGRAPAGGAEQGRVLWERLGCASCHAGGEGGDPGAGDLRHACAFRGGASPQAIVRRVLLGAGDRMPAFAEALPGPRAADDLADYLESIDPAGATWPGTPDRP
jgi:mono/diheme cytochrome c family protein